MFSSVNRAFRGGVRLRQMLRRRGGDATNGGDAPNSNDALDGDNPADANYRRNRTGC